MSHFSIFVISVISKKILKNQWEINWLNIKHISKKLIFMGEFSYPKLILNHIIILKCRKLVYKYLLENSDVYRLNKRSYTVVTLNRPANIVFFTWDFRSVTSKDALSARLSSLLPVPKGSQVYDNGDNVEGWFYVSKSGNPALMIARATTSESEVKKIHSSHIQK